MPNLASLPVRALACAIVLSCVSGCPKDSGSGGTAPTGSPVSGNKVTIHRKMPPVGLKSTQKRVIESTITLDAEPGGATERSEAESRREEVLAIGIASVEKVKVTYVSSETTTKKGGKTTKEPHSILLGHTFIVGSSSSGLVITREGGVHATPEEAATLRRDYALLGHPDPLIVAMPKAQITLGDTVPAVAEALSAMLAEDGTTLDKVEVRLVSVDQTVTPPLAVFAVTGAGRHVEGDHLMLQTVKGTMRVRTSDGWPTDLLLEGDIALHEPSRTPGGTPGARRGGGKSRIAVTAHFE